MKKIKTSLFFLLIITMSSCRQNDEENTFSQDVASGTIEMSRKSADSTSITIDSNEVETYNSALVLDEDPKFPPRK